MTEYGGVLLYIAIATGLGIVILFAAMKIRPRRLDLEKATAYECGFEPFGEARSPFDVGFYLVAILFLVFDLETALLLPWVLGGISTGMSGFFAFLLFLTVLVLGFVFEWQKGALEWNSFLHGFAPRGRNSKYLFLFKIMALFLLKSLRTQKTHLRTRRSLSSTNVAGRPHHGYHLVDPSPWPALTRFCLLWLMVSLVLCFHQYSGAASLAVVAFLSLTYTASLWWRDVNREGILGYHTGKVKNGLHLGMWLFIWSEAMFFVGLLWAFMHAALMPTVQIGMSWPPLGVVPVHWTGLPKTNTLLLLASFFTRNAAKHAIDTNNKSLAKLHLLNTIALGALFLYCQYLEYTGAAFTFSDSVFGSAFYLTTGFHGFHVLVGRIYLAVCYFTISTAGPGKSTAMDLAILYWHFVDVVWVALMLIVYIWGSSLPVVEMRSCTDSSCAVRTLLHERKTYAWSHGENVLAQVSSFVLK